MTPEVGTIWRHYKGQEYEVVGNCVIEETCAPAVLYRKRSGDKNMTIWCRPLSSWNETVHEWAGGVSIRVLRFKRVSP